MVTRRRHWRPCRPFVRLAGLALAVTLLWPTLASADEKLTVVELFSAQGCPLCPPAEIFLGELAGRDDVLPLAFHVDYWDYLGWPDRFAVPGFAKRQQRYSDRMGLPYVYTPQMVVDGDRQASGGQRDAVEAEIAAAAATAGVSVGVRLTRKSPTSLHVEIDARDGIATEADIVLVGFDVMHETAITRGENSGMTLVNYHVVREIKSIATWSGAPLALTVPMAADSGTTDFCAVLVQEAGQGRIIGAARIDMRGS